MTVSLILCHTPLATPAKLMLGSVGVTPQSTREKCTWSWGEETPPFLRSCLFPCDANALPQDRVLRGWRAPGLWHQPLESHFALPNLPILPSAHEKAGKGRCEAL